MAIKNRDGLYECPYCGKTDIHPQIIDACREDHNLVYVALTQMDLNRIITYFYHPDEELIEPALIKRLKKYQRLAK